MNPASADYRKGGIQIESKRTVHRQQQKNLSHQMPAIVRQNQELRNKLQAVEIFQDRAVGKVLELNRLIVEKQEILRNQAEELLKSYETIRELEIRVRNQQESIADLQRHYHFLQRISNGQIACIKAENESLKKCVALLKRENERQNNWIQQLEQMASRKNWSVSVKEER